MRVLSGATFFLCSLFLELEVKLAPDTQHEGRVKQGRTDRGMLYIYGSHLSTHSPVFVPSRCDR